ncbi:hypothetical protein [Methanobacterium formicicum]|nr:hypothetical protein [Methanobacterium formicicum]
MAFKVAEESVHAFESREDPYATHRRSGTFYLVKTRFRMMRGNVFADCTVSMKD